MLTVTSALFVVAAISSALHAQVPPLRVAASSVVNVPGQLHGGAAVYPAHTLELLGFRLAGQTDGVIAVLGADTLRFWNTSPYFRSGERVHQLAFSTAVIDGATYLPEQFFIQWLPATWPQRFHYSGGSLSLRSADAPSAARPDATAAQPRSSAATAQPRAGTARSRNSDRVVIIDPGHGGRDPGKVGPNGLAEKDVALLIGKRLAGILQERGYEVHLTRTNDTYIPLHERPQLANRWKGDRPVALFLSIHANAATARSARGFETFFLSEARTADERRVAEMENESVRFDDDAPAAEDGLAQILNTLRSDFLMRASHDLASVVQDRIAPIHPGPNRGVKRAGFIVLIGAIMPAVLIETAFISNQEEATLLGRTTFRDKLALGIADGVDEFFARNEHLWAQER